MPARRGRLSQGPFGGGSGSTPRGGARGRRHAGGMTTNTLAPERPTGAPPVSPRGQVPASSSVRTATDRIPLLALVAPLLLFAHGIVAWVDGLDAFGGLDGFGP